jgi:cobalt transporter subunit CbtB
MTPSTSSVILPHASSRVLPAIAAFLFGLALFLGAGFVAPSVLHNATHDMRHALGLPCH